MDIYHIWCNLKETVKDLEFCASVNAYLGHLRELGALSGYRISRRKLGLGPPHLGEFHIAIETQDLAQLDRAFNQAAARTGPVEQLHRAVYASVKDVTFALYRDFPDPVRKLP